MEAITPNRSFKTAKFAEDASKAKISDLERCAAIAQILKGQADDLGGSYWIYEYLFAKKDRDNIEHDELLAFRLLAKSYDGLSEHQLGQLLINKDLLEICHEEKADVQK